MVWEKLTPKERITRAKIQLGYDNPFWAYLVMNAKIIDGTKNEIMSDCKTMCATNHGEIYYHDDFVNKLSEAELKGVLAHEVFHIAFNHIERLETLKTDKKKAKLWNISADIVVNNALLNDGFTLASGGIIPQSLNTFEFENGERVEDIDKKSVEMVYNELSKKLEDKKEEELKEGTDKHKHKGKPKSEDESDVNKNHVKDWTQVISEAGTYAKQKGKLSAGVERLVGDLLNPELTWRDKLYKYITKEIPNDFTYTRPSKKSRACGVYLPSTLKENLDVVVGIDTSGSIGQSEYNQFISEMIGLSKSFNNIKLKLMTWDVKVNDTYEFNNGSIEKIKDVKLSGYGGTDVNCLFKEVNKNHNGTKILVILTDGYFGKVTEKYNYNVLWVLTSQNNKRNLSNGEVVELGGR